MLYPKEDPDTHRLQFACRTCQYSEEALSSCVFRNVLNNAVGETAGVTQDVGSDPTVSLSTFLSRFLAFISSAKSEILERIAVGPSKVVSKTEI
jgi:DNA-directed RNA polymerase subunit M/transcription elongation factor TFIIS